MPFGALSQTDQTCAHAKRGCGLLWFVLTASSHPTSGSMEPNQTNVILAGFFLRGDHNAPSFLQLELSEVKTCFIH